MKLSDVIIRDTTANQPAANAVAVGTLFYDTTLSTMYRSNGSSWESVEGTGGASDHGALTGLTDDDHTQYPLVTDFESDRATIQTNWTDLTDSGETTLHSHAASSEATDVANVEPNPLPFEQIIASSNVTVTEVGNGNAIQLDIVKNKAAADNYTATFTSSGTSTAVTTTAFSAGANLIALVGSTGRGCNSITQTNVTWTQRYTGNSGSRWAEIWTGVASATTGTTATFAFTGANTQQCGVFQMPNTNLNFTSATASNTASGTGTNAAFGWAITEGDYYIVIYSGGNPASGYGAITHHANAVGTTGGALSAQIFLADFNGYVEAWRTFSSSVTYMFAGCKME